jgi:hypothetical protein
MNFPRPFGADEFILADEKALLHQEEKPADNARDDETGRHDR